MLVFGGGKIVEFEEIILKYQGFDADGSRIDLGQIGQSLQGAAQLLGSAASIVSTGEYAKQTARMPVRILAGIPKKGSWEIPAIIISTGVSVGQIDMFAHIGKKLASEATTKIVNYVVASFGTKSRKRSDLEVSLATVDKAMAEVGQTSRHAIDAVVRMAEQQKPAIRALVVPVGLSCEVMQVGNASQGGILIDKELREAIDAPSEFLIEAARKHEILISEMDRLNQTCKFAFREETDLSRRYAGQITDPIIQTPNDPYSEAFSSARWVTVIGKLQTRDGGPDRLFISDIEAWRTG